LSPDGPDFGTAYDGADQYYETDMLEMWIGLRINRAYGDETAEYVVVYMTPLI